MGVTGLFTYVKNNAKYDSIDLVEAARKSLGMEILIDFYGFQFHLSQLIISKIAEKYENDFLLFPGGEFDIIHKGFYDFQKAFESVNVKLVWIIDGPDSVDVDGTSQRVHIWTERAKETIEKFDKLLIDCSSKSSLEYVEPQCSVQEIIDALKKAGAEVIQLLQGEADDFMVYEFNRRKSFAIITNDTDFFIFPNCRTIFTNLINFDNLFYDNENGSGEIFKVPNEFFCPIITHQMIQDLFKFRRSDQLIALSILKGNDNTREFSFELHFHLKITNKYKKHAHISDIAKFIINNEITMNNIRRHPSIKSFMIKRPRFGVSLNFCDSHYSLDRIKENLKSVIYQPNHFTNQLTEYLAYKLSKSEMSVELFSIHFGSFRESIYLESPHESCKSISTVMEDIKSLIYPYVLIESNHEVVEWRPRELIFFHELICHQSLKINEIKSNKKGNLINDSGLDLFNRMWSHLELSTLNYFHKFDIVGGFICYILRYFHQITKNKNLELSENEFKALFVTIFYNYSISQGIYFNTDLTRESFLKLRIRPSKKCLIINSWFLYMFYWAKYCCGGPLNLDDEFPSIQNLFNGSIFFAFYEYIMNESNGGLNHLENGRQYSIQLLFDMIIDKYNTQYQTITQ